MQITNEDVLNWVRRYLGGNCDDNGFVLGSGIDTLRPGDFYCLGFNPGGAASTGLTICETLEETHRAWSVYTDDCWVCEGGPTCTHLVDGHVDQAFLHKHQKNVAKIFHALDRDPANEFCTNAVFGRSSRTGPDLERQTKKSGWAWWEMCWPVHQHFLSIVRPKYILSLGKGHGESAFAFMRHKAMSRSVIEEMGPHKSDGRRYTAEFPLLDGDTHSATVIGLPHPSYYAISPQLETQLGALSASLPS